jgi:hypothetical protein
VASGLIALLMLPAKLFTALVVIFAVFAGLAYLNPFPSLDLYVHGIYCVLRPGLVLLFCMVTSANFAILYYAGDRFFHARWNRTLSLLHVCLFLCFAISLPIVLAVSTRAANGGGSGEAIRWMIVPWLTGIFGLVASFVVFAINLALVVVQVVRTRLARR